MSFYRDVTRKPWNTVGLPEGIEPRPAFNMPNEKVALIIFATCASVLFSLLVVSYFIRMTVGDWVPLATPTMLWVNTGIHVLHLLGGLWVWGRAQLRLALGANVDRARLSLELCAWYWHFLLVIWAILFYLLAST